MHMVTDPHLGSDVIRATIPQAKQKGTGQGTSPHSEKCTKRKVLRYRLMRI